MIEQIEDCPECEGRRFIAEGHGVFHAETGTQTCPERVAREVIRAILGRIVERDAELLKRLADS